MRYEVRGMTCARCNKETDNNNQGHYWAFCSVTKELREFHFCCPGDCQLETDGRGPRTDSVTE